MAAVDAIPAKRSLGDLADPELSLHKRFKFSELPLTSNQKSAIDGLVHTIKKKGIYDKLRSQVWAQYLESVGLSTPIRRRQSLLTLYQNL